MTIKFKNYILRPRMCAKDRFDLVQVTPLIMKDMPLMRKKYPNANIGDVLGGKEQELAYGICLETAIEKLIRTDLAESQEIFDLKGYLDAYKKERIAIENLLK